MMDPNEALKRMLELAIRISEIADQEGNINEGDVIELADDVQNLDTWLLKGGFLPDRWQYAEKK